MSPANPIAWSQQRSLALNKPKILKDWRQNQEGSQYLEVVLALISTGSEKLIKSGGESVGGKC